MRIIKPKRLKKGDIIGIIAPASPVWDSNKIDKSIRYFEQLGYHVELGEHILKRHGYLAGIDEERIEDFHAMIANPKIKAIIALRGGYGAGRIVDRVDYTLIRKNPKILVGYSDLTILQNAILSKAGLVTFSGPMAASDFSGTPDSFTEEFFWRILTSAKKIGKISNPDNEDFFSINKSKESGKLIGGNLTNFNALFGTEFLPALKNLILYVEEITEPPYKIDRMFNHLRLAGILDKLNGIVLGRFVNCNKCDSQVNTLNLNEVIHDYLAGLSIPVIYNVKIGHIKAKLTFPIGAEIGVDGSKGIIEFLQAAVR